MATPLQERKDMDPAFMWDLKKMYESDEAFDKDLAAIDEKISKVASYAGTLNNADNILAYYKDATEFGRKLSFLFEYAQLRHSEDTRQEAAQSMFSRVYGKYVMAQSALAFAEPEILSLDEETLKSIVEDPKLAEYRHSLEVLLEQKPHVLSKEAETLLAGFGEVFAAPGQISESLMDADMTFAPVKDGEGNEQEVTGSNYILLQTSTDRVLRENSFHSFYDGFKGHINTFAGTYSAAVKGACATASARHYTSSRQMSMADEHVPEQVYDNLTNTVREFLPAMYRYASLRKKILKLDELHYYDLYTPLVAESEKHYTYEEAQQMVLEAVSPLGEEYCNTVRKAFAENWIDVYPNKGKRGGAFSAGCYDSAPYILTNFTGTLDSVSTIAHEMGHSMHTWRSIHTQPPQYADYTLFVAEVASTVNENLLVERLLEQEKDPVERLKYLNQYLEGFKGTVFRQTMFAEFERTAHEMAERGEALTAGALNEVYRKLVEDYFGPELVMDDDTQYEWARIPHFYRPFYVYKYATSYCSSVAISEMIRTEGEPAVKRYLEFLSMGGSKYPLDELAHAGVDLTTAEPLRKALRKFEQIVDEAEKLAGM